MYIHIPLWEYLYMWNGGVDNERGDVKGVFCGHEHINTHVGDCYGVQLGYGPGTGFASYGLGDGTDRNSLRGSRVFTLNQNTSGVNTDTFTLFAADFGIDTTAPQKQPSEPREFPDYVL